MMVGKICTMKFDLNTVCFMICVVHSCLKDITVSMILGTVRLPSVPLCFAFLWTNKCIVRKIKIIFFLVVSLFSKYGFSLLF